MRAAAVQRFDYVVIPRVETNKTSDLASNTGPHYHVLVYVLSGFPVCSGAPAPPGAQEGGNPLSALQPSKRIGNVTGWTNGCALPNPGSNWFRWHGIGVQGGRLAVTAGRRAEISLA